LPLVNNIILIRYYNVVQYVSYEIDLAPSSVPSGAICSIRTACGHKTSNFLDAKLRTFAQTSEYQDSGRAQKRALIEF
jgi:hypothetical protein